jgi:Ribonuclease G/E
MRRELVISAGPGEWRAALTENGAPVELRVERGDGAEAGSIHLGRVVRLLPALGAVLVDIGGDRPAFLPQAQIFPRARRLDEGARVLVAIRREAQAGKAPQLTTALRPPAGIVELISNLAPPARLFPAPTLAAALAGVVPAVERVLVDEPAVVADIRTAFPEAAVVQLPETEWPFALDALFDEALSSTVALPGGGSVHFEPTSAAMLIDVDSGAPQSGSPERTALAINLVAAETIARQIRLRNLGGGIVIDFVGLDDRGARERIRATLANGLAADPLQPQILGWTRLGHLELQRRRRTSPLADALLEPAPGGAFVKTAAMIAHEALRTLARAARLEPARSWRLLVTPAVAATLAGAAAGAVAGLEQRLGRTIMITADVSLGRDRFEIAPA